MARLRVLALMEAETVAGPAKNLLRFAVNAQRPGVGDTTAEIVIASYRRSGRPTESVFLGRARELGLTTERIEESFRFDPRALSQLQAILGRVKPDLIQTHNVKSHLLAKLTGAYRKCPWIAFHHGYTATDFKVQAYNQCDRFSLRSATRVVTVCGAFVNQLVDRGVDSNRIVVRHNTVEPFHSAPAEEVAGLRDRFRLHNQNVAVSIGRLSKEKGHLDLVDAWAKLPAELRSEAHLVLVGEGPERGPVEQRIHALGLDANVILAGHHSDVRPWYQLADLLILPSHSEGSPNVLLEAMAAQVPIVATSVGGVPEIVDDQRTGLLARAGDRGALTDAVARLLSDVDFRRSLAEAGLRRCQTEFTPDSYCRSLLGLYEELAGTAA